MAWMGETSGLCVAVSGVGQWMSFCGMESVDASSNCFLPDHLCPLVFPTRYVSFASSKYNKCLHHRDDTL